MTITEYTDKLGRVIKQLHSEKGDELIVKAAISGLTLIKSRVQETGVNAKGDKFKPYSTKDTLVGSTSFLQKKVGQTLFNTKEKRKEFEWRTVKGHHLAILEGGYKKIRELEGRQTDHVDFSVTNAMWNDITIVSTKSDHRNGKAIIAAKQDIEKKKLAGNTAKRGDILDLNHEEVTLLTGSYNLGVLNIFKENGL